MRTQTKMPSGECLQTLERLCRRLRISRQASIYGGTKHLSAVDLFQFLQSTASNGTVPLSDEIPELLREVNDRIWNEPDFLARLAKFVG